MARITVEDCIKKISNRFEMVVLSSKRARDIASGATIYVKDRNDKAPVIALREIAEDKISKEELLADVISSYQNKEIYRTDLHSSKNEEADSSNTGIFSQENVEIDD